MIETYNMLADEKELKWFFDNVIQKPKLYESYSMVWVSRHKKLTKEEQKVFGMTRAESEFLKTEVIRGSKIHDTGKESEFTFDSFLKHVLRFNCDMRAYTMGNGEPIPYRTLAVLFYVNPCNDYKVADMILDKVNQVKTQIMAGVTNGKTFAELAPMYQGFGNLDSDLKHYRALCKGTSYWMDFDVDVPNWFRPLSIAKLKIDEVEYSVGANNTDKYYNMMLDKLNARFGKGNYVIVSTSGGYHILVRTNSIRSNPHDFCKEVEEIYKLGISEGMEEYKNEKGEIKFEAIVNDSQIPGLPLPGTCQYGRPVTVLNKEDFENEYEIWMDSFMVQGMGEPNPVSLLGKASGTTFRDAVEKFMKTYPQADEYFNKGSLTYYGCKLAEHREEFE